MEESRLGRQFWQDRRVLVTGHTGFKGAWLCLWLHSLGAKVFGYSLAPATRPSLFEISSAEALIEQSIIADIRDASRLKIAFDNARPEILFHLAAQSLVLPSYQDPVETVSVNVLGTAMVLDAARHCASLRAIINVTSDKCYENIGTSYAYRESDPMGGHDPYSASKGAAELITTSFRRSFFSEANNQGGNVCGLASVRAGNVIGGGDWADNRLVPDFFHARTSQQPLVIRAPRATRPWQHVLEPLSGYMLLAQKIASGEKGLDEGWNFGPGPDSVKPVEWITLYLADKFGGKVELDKNTNPHEAAILQLDSSKAQNNLGWAPRWDLETALDKTGQWFEAWQAGADMGEFSVKQIGDYSDTSIKQN